MPRKVASDPHPNKGGSHGHSERARSAQDDPGPGSDLSVRGQASTGERATKDIDGTKSEALNEVSTGRLTRLEAFSEKLPLNGGCDAETYNPLFE